MNNAKRIVNEILIEDLKEAQDRVNELELMINPTAPTTRDKIKTYEGLLHDIQMYAEVVLNGEAVKKLIHNICSWSYAHRAGNGEFSEDEQERMITKAFLNLRAK